MTSDLNIVFEIVCLATAVLFLRNVSGIFTFFTIVYLLIVCSTEIAGGIWTSRFGTSNSWIYNIFIIYEAAYISFGLYVALKGLTKRAYQYCSIAFMGFLVTYGYELSSQSFFKFNSKTVLVFSILFSFNCFTYFYLLIKDKNTINLKQNGQFWWVAGVYAYYFGGTIYNLFLQQSSYPYIILSYTMILLNLILYGFWSYSFICNSRQQK